VDNLAPATPQNQAEYLCGRPLQGVGIRVPAIWQKDCNPTVWSFLFLVAGIVLLIFSPDFIFVSVPLFLTSFALSVIAVAKRRAASGIMMMILAFIVPPVCIFEVLACALSKNF
jgi:hypothetical protein